MKGVGVEVSLKLGFITPSMKRGYTYFGSYHYLLPSPHLVVRTGRRPTSGPPVEVPLRVPFTVRSFRCSVLSCFACFLVSVVPFLSSYCRQERGLASSPYAWSSARRPLPPVWVDVSMRELAPFPPSSSWRETFL